MRATLSLLLLGGVSCASDAARPPADADGDALDAVSADSDAPSDTVDIAVASTCATTCAELSTDCGYGRCDHGVCVVASLHGYPCDDGRADTRDDRCDWDNLCHGVPDPTVTPPPDLASDPKNCGALGQVCPGADATCTDGHCTRCVLDAGGFADLNPVALVCPDMPGGVVVRGALEGPGGVGPALVSIPTGRTELWLQWYQSGEVDLSCQTDARCATEPSCGEPDGCVEVLDSGAGPAPAELVRERLAWAPATHTLGVFAAALFGQEQVVGLSAGRLVLEVEP
ncbi:MAG: hypothetical protein U1F43_29580 [Myxococcota bacterium]